MTGNNKIIGEQANASVKKSLSTGEAAPVIYPNKFHQGTAKDNSKLSGDFAASVKSNVRSGRLVDFQGDVMSEITREEIQAQIAVSEARGETKLVRLEGKIDTAVATLSGKIDAVSEKISADHEFNRNTKWTLIVLFVTGFLAVAGLVVGMATYGDALFGRGMDVRELVQTTIKETLAQQAHEQAGKK